MPETGRYEKIPRPQSIETLRRYLTTKPIVSSTELVGTQILLIRRKQKPDLEAFLTNIYTVGEADIYEILSAHSSIDVIVAISGYNSYSEQAKELCKERSIGLFTFREFMGAVYYADRQLLDYEPPEERKRKASS